MLLVGMGTPVQTLPISAAALREIDLIGVWRYANCYPESIAMMEATATDGSRPHLKKMLTHNVKGLESVPEAFDLAAQPSDAAGRVVVKVVVENA